MIKICVCSPALTLFRIHAQCYDAMLTSQIDVSSVALKFAKHKFWNSENALRGAETRLARSWQSMC